MDIAGAVLDPEELRGLGEEGSDGVVAGDLAMMRVVAAEGAFHLKTGTDHRAIHIDGEPAELQFAHRVGQDLGVERLERGPHRRRAAAQPAAERALAGHRPQTGEAMDERIADHIPNMTEPTGSDDEQGHHQPHHPHRCVVSSRITGPQMTPQAIREVRYVQELSKELQTAVGGESLGGEANRQIGLDGGGEKAFSMSHRWWPFGSGRKLFRHFFLYDRKAHSAREKAASVVGDRLFLCAVMTHWG